MASRFGKGRSARRKRLNATAPLLLIDAPGQHLAKAGIGFHYADCELAGLKGWFCQTGGASVPASRLWWIRGRPQARGDARPTRDLRQYRRISPCQGIV